MKAPFIIKSAQQAYWNFPRQTRMDNYPKSRQSSHKLFFLLGTEVGRASYWCSSLADILLLSTLVTASPSLPLQPPSLLPCMVTYVGMHQLELNIFSTSLVNLLTQRTQSSFGFSFQKPKCHLTAKFSCNYCVINWASSSRSQKKWPNNSSIIVSPMDGWSFQCMKLGKF